VSQKVVRDKYMDKAKLAAKNRQEKGRKTEKGRHKGLIPAVIYGRGIDSLCVWVDALSFRKLLKKSGESTIINLEIEKKDNRNVIIQDIQRDPVSHKIIHLDFFQVRMDEEIETEVELVFVGEAPAVRELGGILVKNIDKLEIKCLPADLPSHIDVDVSVLKTFENNIAISDLKVGKGIKIQLEPETVIAIVTPPRSEEELKELEEKVEEDITKVEGMAKEENVTAEKTEKKD
jgi:large subunit ribosomal protein L25